MKEAIRTYLLWCFALLSIGVGIFAGIGERAVRKDEAPAQAERVAAVRELEKGDVAEATRSALEALALEPDDAMTWEILGGLLEHQGRPGDAAAAYERAVELDGHRFGPFFALAQIHRARGATEAAQKALTRARELEPTHPGAAALGGELAEERGDPGRALDLFLEAARASGGKRRATYLERAARLQESKDDEAAAAKTLLQAAQADPGDPLRWARAAAMLEAVGEEEAARSALERQAMTEATPGAWMRVAQAHEQAGEAERAAHARRRAMDACARQVRDGARNPGACTYITG